MGKSIISLHLISILGGICLFKITTTLFSLSMGGITVASAIFIFYLSFYQVISFAGIPDEIIRRSVREDFEKHKGEYDKELEQEERKRDFQEAFETEQEKNERNDRLDEIALYNKNYELAKSSYKGKDKSKLSELEKVHYYSAKLRKMNKVSKVPTIIIMFSFGFLTMFNSYITMKILFLIYLPIILIIIPFFAYQKSISKKIKHYESLSQPESVKEIHKIFDI